MLVDKFVKTNYFTNLTSTGSRCALRLMRNDYC